MDGNDVDDEAVAAPGGDHVPVRDAGAGRPRQAPRVQRLNEGLFRNPSIGFN